MYSLCLSFFVHHNNGAYLCREGKNFLFSSKILLALLEIKLTWDRSTVEQTQFYYVLTEAQKWNWDSRNDQSRQFYTFIQETINLWGIEKMNKTDVWEY